MTQRRRLLLLSAVLVALFAYLASTTGPDLFRGESSRGSGRSSRSASVIGAQTVPLDLEALNQKPGTYRPGRDLFRYGGAPQEQKAPPPKRVPAPQPKPQPIPQTPAAAPPPKPQPPPVDVVFMGSFGRPGRKIAVFTDDETIYNAMVGDVVKDVFVLVNIGFESVDLGFVGFPDVEARRLAVGGS